MRDPVASAQLGSEFDAFVFAPVDDEKNGMVLSVLSALARLDVYPWQEAAELTRMPRNAANQRLTALIAALPDAASTRLQPDTIADRLIELLPRGDISSITSRAKSLGASAVPNAQGVARMITINLLLMFGILCAQWALASLKPPASAEAIHAPTSGAALPPISPSSPEH